MEEPANLKPWGVPEMGTESPSTPSAPKNISRRRVVAGAAWSVPAVMVASAAPAVAASKPPVYPNLASGYSCKLPGDSIPDKYGCWLKGYVLFVDFVNTFNYPVYVKVTDLDVSGVPDMQLVGTTLTSACSTLSECIEIPAKSGTTPGTRQVAVFGNGSTDSASNVTVSVSYNWYETASCGDSAISAEVEDSVSGDKPWGVSGNDQGVGACTRPGNCEVPPTIPGDVPCPA